MDSMAKYDVFGAARAGAICAIIAAFGSVSAQDSSPSGPTLDGIASNCNAFYTVGSDDTCYSVEETFSITSDEFLDWNPAVSNDCGTNFWAGKKF